jgi:predicted RNA binding protein YcfA (HicA-like mRNA interferase family)
MAPRGAAPRPGFPFQVLARAGLRAFRYYPSVLRRFIGRKTLARPGAKRSLTRHAHCAYILNVKFQEIERILLKDGWRLKAANGSHHQYVHSTKRGKVTIPYHSGDLHPKTINAILKQAGLR